MTLTAQRHLGAVQKLLKEKIEAKVPPGKRRDVLLFRTVYGKKVIPDAKDFMEAYFFIEDKKTEKPMQWVFNRPQKLLYYLYQRNTKFNRESRFATLKARQFGISTAFMGLGLERVLRNDGAKAAIIGDTDMVAGKLLDQAKMIRDMLPVPVPFRRDNRRELFLPLPWNSRYVIASASAKNPIRGHTFHYIHCTETAHWPDHEIKLRAINPAFAGGPGSLLSHETTANGIDNWFHDFWWDARDSKSFSAFQAFFFPWYFDPAFDYCDPVTEAECEEVLETLLDEEKELMREGVELGQLKWRRRTIATDYFGDAEGFSQEYPGTPEEAFLASGRPVFVPQFVMKVLGRCSKPGWTGEILPTGYDGERLSYDLVQGPGGCLSIWKAPEGRHSYSIGVDSGHGITDGDNSVASVIDMETGEQVAEWVGIIESGNFGRIVAALGQYYHDAYVMPEMDGPGTATVTAMTDAGYYNIALRPTLDTPGYKRQDKLGWNTNVKTKMVLINRIRIELQHQATQEGAVGVNSRLLCKELSSYQMTDRGSYTAPSGKHDDRVIAWGLAIVGRQDAIETGHFEDKPKEVPQTVEERHWADWHQEMDTGWDEEDQEALEEEEAMF